MSYIDDGIDRQRSALPGAARRNRALPCIATGLSMLICVGCDDATPRSPAAPPAPGVVLGVDGLRFTRAEVHQFDDYFDEVDPRMGRNYKAREVLDRYLIPLALARRAFGAEREELHARARDLCAVADNAIELERKGGLAGGTVIDPPATRNALAFPVARFAFRLENVGRASDPIETPRGFVVIAPKHVERAMTTVGDRLTAFIVPFHTHPPEEFDRWLATARAELRGKISYVAPELRDALPPFLEAE